MKDVTLSAALRRFAALGRETTIDEPELHVAVVKIGGWLHRPGKCVTARQLLPLGGDAVIRMPGTAYLAGPVCPVCDSATEDVWESAPRQVREVAAIAGTIDEAQAVLTAAGSAAGPGRLPGRTAELSAVYRQVRSLRGKVTALTDRLADPVFRAAGRGITTQFHHLVTDMTAVVRGPAWHADLQVLLRIDLADQGLSTGMSSDAADVALTTLHGTVTGLDELSEEVLDAYHAREYLGGRALLCPEFVADWLAHTLAPRDVVVLAADVFGLSATVIQAALDLWSPPEGSRQALGNRSDPAVCLATAASAAGVPYEPSDLPEWVPYEPVKSTAALNVAAGLGADCSGRTVDASFRPPVDDSPTVEPAEDRPLAQQLS